MRFPFLSSGNSFFAEEAVVVAALVDPACLHFYEQF